MKVLLNTSTSLLFVALLMAVFSVVYGEEQKQTAEIEGHTNKVLQLIERESKRSVYQHSSVKGRYNLVVQIVGNIPPRQLDEFLKNADDRQELARQLDVTEEALVTFTEDVLEKKIDIADWPDRLQEIATRYHALKDQIDSYEGNDRIIRELKDKARVALSRLDWKDARQYLVKAAKHDIEIANELETKHRERRISAAESIAQGAEAALIGFDYLLAAQDYLLAVEQLPADTEVIRARYLNQAALNLDNGGRYKEAEPLYLKGLEIRQQLLGEKHPDTALSYNNVASNLNAQGRYEEAEPLFRKGLEINQQVLGEKHPFTAGSYNNVAYNLDDQGRYEEAEPLLRKAVKLIEKSFGYEHPNSKDMRDSLEAFLRKIPGRE